MLNIKDRYTVRYKYIVDLSNFKVIQKLNSGGYGQIYLIQDKKTKKELAAKILQLDEEDELRKKMINREIGIMMLIQHPAFIQFHGYSLHDFKGGNNVTIIMDYAKNGSLSTILSDVQRGLSDINKYNNTTRQKILIGIAGGMMYLHQNHIIHRDLKPDNVLIDELFNPHITDFGLSKIFVNGRSQNQTQAYGTSIYMAPEVIKGGKYNGKADVYSFGILMFEVVTDTVPYPLFQSNRMSFFQFSNKVVNEKYRPEFTVPVKESIKQLIIQCWSHDANERPTFEEIFNKLAFNLEESVYDVFEGDEEYKYYLEDVDVDEVLSYAFDITNKEGNESIEKNSNENEIEELKKKNDMLMRQNEAMKSKLNEHELTIQKLAKENEQLMKDNKKMKNDIKRLFEMINEDKEKAKVKIEKRSDKKKAILIAYDEDQRFNGIINYLSFTTGGNVCQNQTVLVTSNSVKDNVNDCINVVEPDHFYVSNDNSGIYLCFDFKKRSVQLSGYSIKTGNGDKFCSHLRNWVLQVSNDKVNWKTVDSHQNDRSLNGPLNEATFNVMKDDDFYRFVRILSTGDSWNRDGNNKRVCIKQIEFYGMISEP